MENNRRPFSLISQPHVVSHTAQGRPWPGPIWSTHIWGAPFAKALYGIVLGWYGIVLGEEFQDDEIPNLASLNTILEFRIFGKNASIHSDVQGVSEKRVFL